MTVTDLRTERERSTRDMLQANVDSTREYLATVDLDAESPDEESIEREQFEEGILDLYVTAEVRSTGTTPQTLTLVLGTGGPHIEAVVAVDGRTWAEVRGYWGGDRIVESVTLSDTVLAWCQDYADMLDAEQSRPTYEVPRLPL